MKKQSRFIYSSKDEIQIKEESKKDEKKKHEKKS